MPYNIPSTASVHALATRVESPESDEQRTFALLPRVVVLFGGAAASGVTSGGGARPASGQLWPRGDA